MFVHLTWEVLPGPKFAFQRNCLFRYPALSLLNVVLVLRPSSVPETEDIKSDIYHT